MSPLMALGWKSLAGGVRSDGQWRSTITMKRWGQMHEMYVTLDAELEVQRTSKRAELTAFLCLLKENCRFHNSPREQPRNY